MFTIGGLFAAFLVLGIIGAIVNPQPRDTATTSTSITTTPPPPLATTTTAPPPPPLPAVVLAPPPPPVETVTRVVDGDTFVIGARTIRVLGIDSCEAATDAGPAATATATALLAAPVVLSGEPGVDRDRYGRELRYVRLGDGQDFGTAMVRETHTAVYAGRNDASPTYVASLRAADPNDRTCDYPDPPPPFTNSDAPYIPYVPEPDPDTYVPAPTPRRRTGNSGHLCLPGERDGDGDGYCGEGR